MCLFLHANVCNKMNSVLKSRITTRCKVDVILKNNIKSQPKINSMNALKKNGILMIILSLSASNYATDFNKPPHWAENVIWYQIFVERFHNADSTNDQKAKDTTVPDMKIVPPAGWKTTNWTGDWFTPDEWMKDTSKSFSDLLQYRRYGGDLQGVLNKLDYLQELGVTALYINPINDAPSLHKYDARNYHHVDVNFGPDPEGDLKIIASEIPDDPTTWQWTSADKLFLKLIEEVHKRGMRIIMDYSWNHTGTTFWAWIDILKNQSASKFKDWYNISSFDLPQTPENEFKYDGWYGNAYMPEFRKTDIRTERIGGKPYEGNIDAGAKKHIFDVTKRWLAPNGDTTKGIDGYRLDVADQIGLNFWREYRTFVRSVNSEAYLVGEIWWEKWPDILMDPQPYLKGDIFDAVMFYQVYRPARYFFAKTDDEINAKQFKDSLEYHWNKIPIENLRAMMNVSSSHDAPRLLTDFYNSNKYKYHANPNENPNYKTGKPNRESFKHLELYLIHLFTSVGSPHIWNGEEMGMWGADDPFGRKPLCWNEMDFEPENRLNIQKHKPKFDKISFNANSFEFYKNLINIRKNNPVLAFGKIKFELAEGKKLIYLRYDENEEIRVIFNLEKSTKTFYFPIGNYTNLLTKEIIHTNKIKLKSNSAIILKRIN